MNQGMAGLIIGAVLGLALGFFIAPTETAPIPGLDAPDLACLEGRTALAAEIRSSLARMADAGCACDEMPLEALSGSIEPVAGSDPQPTSIADAGPALEPVVEPLEPLEPAPSASPEAGSSRDAAPAPSDAAAQPGLVQPTGAQWMVQLIATPDAKEAKRVEAKAQGLGLPTERSHELVPALGKKLYKVRVGPFGTKLEGKEALNELKSKAGIADGWIHPRR